MRWLLLPLLLMIAGCGAAPGLNLASRDDTLPLDLPQMRTFDGQGPKSLRLPNNSALASDYLALTFQMESGTQIPQMTRFEGPIDVVLTSPVSPVFEKDLDDLIARLRSEAHIPISRGTDIDSAEILIETLPRRKLHQIVPQAACFVVPRVSGWKDFRKNRRSGKLDWTTLDRREKVTIFIPNDVAPQEARDCLHEEIAQALGPLNDIYRLADSAFNDDNIHAVLTGFDMTILRITYDSALRSGLTQAEVTRRLPAILTRINPAGGPATHIAAPDVDFDWVTQIETALAPRSTAARRVTAARRAVQLAREAAWQDNRLGFSHLALARMSLGSDGRTAPDNFLQAYKIYATLYGTDDIHTAHAALQRAAFALSQGQADEALSLINTSIPAVQRAQNAALLATMLMIKAEALDHLGRLEEGAAVRLDSLGWARYGFGSDREIRERLREIARLRPQKSKPEIG